MRKPILLLACILVCNYLHAQTSLNKDSLLRLLPAVKEDTAAVELYINLGQQYEGNEPETAKRYYRMANELSKKINYPRGIIKFITNYTFLLNMQGLYDSSLLLNLQSVEISRQIKDSLYLAKTLFNTGTSYRNLVNYEKAIEYYEEGKKLFQLFNNELIEIQADDILQVLSNDLRHFEKGVQYGEHAVMLARKNKQEYMLGIALSNLGMNYASLSRFKSSDSIHREALQIAKRLDDQNMELTAYLNIANNRLQLGDYKPTLPYYQKSLQLSKQLEIPESELIALKGLSYFYTYEKNYPLAKQYVDSALAICYRFDFKVQRVHVLTQLSNLAYAMQQVQLGEDYAVHSTNLQDSILNQTVQRNSQELEKKYETANKESQIKQLEADKKLQQLTIKQKSFTNYILIGGALSLVLIILLSYRSYRQKQRLQQQRINELETEKQLTATAAVLKGEDQERTRMAKDLHDGLGGMLSGIKFSLTNMKGNLIMTADNAQAFERSIDMLDSSIKEMRRVAHNMMPENLVRFGLDTALRDFVNEINQTGALQINYQSFGMEKISLEPTTEITIYRIIQELVNNIMKHAAAKAAIVQLTKTGDHLSVTVEDDGKGFDTSILKAADGMGWSNIRNRVEFLKGTVDVSSQPGKGSSFLIDLAV